MNLQISRDVNEIILRTMLWSGFERLINPMIPSLIDRYRITFLALTCQ